MTVASRISINWHVTMTASANWCRVAGGSLVAAGPAAMRVRSDKSFP
jgi:hypothetical protein